SSASALRFAMQPAPRASRFAYARYTRPRFARRSSFPRSAWERIPALPDTAPTMHSHAERGNEERTAERGNEERTAERGNKEAARIKSASFVLDTRLHTGILASPAHFPAFPLSTLR